VEIISRRPDRSVHRTAWGQVHRRARALAECLTRAGMQRGDRVATLMWNHATHLEAYFGVPVAGGVVHTLNPRLPADDLAFIINHAADRFLIVDDVLWPLFEQLGGRVKLERILVVQHTAKPLPAGALSYEEFLAQSKGDFTYPQLDEREAGAMCYTSGTTGRPKGVLYSHRSLVLHTFGIAPADCFGLAQQDTMFIIVPMFHANCWGLPFLGAMIGCRIVLPGPHYDAESLLDLFHSEQVTYAAGVPTIWLGILEAFEKSPGRWEFATGLRMTCGGAAAPEAMLRRFDRLGVRVIHSWGMTEMTPAGTTSYVKSTLDGLTADEKYALRAKQGLPFPFVEVRGMAGDRVIPWDGQTMGELHVRGPWIASSYYNMPEAQDRWSADGWFRTGDVVTIDPEGYVKITDRTKDLIKSGGEWISSLDMENELMSHPAVQEAAVIAIPHEKWGERPLACVVLRNGSAATPEELRAHLSAKFASWQLPDAFAFVEGIPRTAVGKFKKSALREKFSDWKWM
jgi:fatty-acyl-CoA synthase